MARPRAESESDSSSVGDNNISNKKRSSTSKKAAASHAENGSMRKFFVALFIALLVVMCFFYNAPPMNSESCEGLSLGHIILNAKNPEIYEPVRIFVFVAFNKFIFQKRCACLIGAAFHELK